MNKTVSISKLKPNPANPRVLRDDKFAKLKASIQSFPDMLNKRPIVAVTDTDGKLMVLGGNMRLRACQDLKMKEVPVILADEWTEEQRREFIIKDNVGFGEWDWDALANEWDEVELSEWGMDIPEATKVDPIVTKALVPYEFAHALVSFAPDMAAEVLPVIEELQNKGVRVILGKG